ncbi:ABC transporter permease subunit [Halocynthiibacter namhaensis]|uniref:ABC transporter permease subunit n=1 Tax=Halocynthiibacter namhaensis TaxID=1290553 RepID=UPI000A85B3B5|nr:ABC transporter permease subunit [Halocynthiibacter namhaensis]
MNILRRTALILPPYLWLLMLFLIPFAIVFKISLSEYALAIPRYMPQYDPETGIWHLITQLSFENYRLIGAGAVIAVLSGIALLAALIFLFYPRLRSAFSGETDGSLSDRLAAFLLGLAAAAVLVILGTIALSWFFPSLSGFVELQDHLYYTAYLSSLKIALFSTCLTLAVGFPFAWAMARSPAQYRPMLMMLVILPFWTSFLIRVYAWRGILSQTGYLNQILMALGIIDEPLVILNTNIAVYIGIVYTYLPFMVLPIYATLEKLDESLNEAAIDLGCTRTSAFWLVTVPLSRPGVIAGCFLVFIPALGEYVIPELLGGSNTLMIGKVLVEEFEKNGDWPVASAVAVILLLILIIPIVLFQRNQQKNQEAGL